MKNKKDKPLAMSAIIDAGNIFSSTIASHKEIKILNRALFQACSFSKSLTAFAILMLANDGIINLDSPINNQLKTWRIPTDFAVTARQCLSMTSGLTYGSLETQISGYGKNDPIPTLQNILDGQYPAKNTGIQCSDTPGSTCRYSGAGFMVLQKLIEEMSGQTFSNFMREKILLPLDMINSTFECPLTKQQRAIPGFDELGKMIPNGYENNPHSASGGLWSTPLDIAKFMIALSDAYRGKNTTLISQTLAHQMLTQQHNSNFALGLVVDGEGSTVNFRKTGHNSGYYCQLLMFPNRAQGIVVMTNSATGIHLIHEIIASTAIHYQWPPYSSNFNE